jgi:hypothetical protein
MAVQPKDEGAFTSKIPAVLLAKKLCNKLDGTQLDRGPGSPRSDASSEMGLGGRCCFVAMRVGQILRRWAMIYTEQAL